MKNKLLIIIAIVIILSVVLTVYFKSDKYSNINIETKDIMNNILKGLGNDVPPMMQLDDEQVKDEYNIDILKVENYIIKIPMMNIRADEIAIVKVKNMSDVQYIKNKFGERARLVENTFKGYLQDQYELAGKPLIISKGKYILMSISDRNDDIQNIFENCITNNK
jgi:hypothetical protein